MQSFKSFLSESKLKAEDYEAAIVIGFYHLQGKEYDPESVGISKNIHDIVTSNPMAMEAGKRIAEKLLKQFPKLKGKKAEQYGRAKSTLTPFWKSHGAGDITPKTDILIGDMRFSLKIGLAQLMSGGKAESTATFYAALENSNKDLQKSTQFKKTSAVLENFVTNTLAPTQLRPLIKSGENEVINKAEAAHKDAMSELGKLFEQNQDFKIAFAREAMSGFMKFGEKNNAAAEYMLVATHDGSSVQVHSVYDDDYCLGIANKMRLQARFKTSSRKLGGKKTGEYNFWSVISLIVNAMDEDFEKGSDLLTESFLGKLKSWFSRTWKRASSFFKNTANNLISFLGAIPLISVKEKINF